jgi:hypothetical protein
MPLGLRAAGPGGTVTIDSPGRRGHLLRAGLPLPD